MIALGASLFLLFYVLVPGGIFRFALSLVVPVKKFHKTKSQEISFAVLASFLPFWLAMALVWSIATSPFQTNKESNHDRRSAYRTAFTSMDDEKTLAKCLDQRIFWPAINSVLRRQARFLIWFYILVIIEAAAFWWLASRYGKYKRYPIYAFVAEQWLFSSISEWHILLTDFAVRNDVKRDIEVDILTTEGILYQGRVDDYILNAEGELSGILLSDASKFEKNSAEHIHADLPHGFSSGPAILEATISNQSTPVELKINGSNLFFPRERISNLTTRHRPLAAAEIQKATEARLQDRGIKFKVSEDATAPISQTINSTSPSTTVQTPKASPER